MNPNTTIKPWLLACGKQFGIRKAFDFRWADSENRQEEVYCDYRMASATPEEVGQHNLSYANGYDHHRKGCMSYLITVEINLYNAEDGMYILEGCGVMAHHSEPLRRIFKNAGVAFVEVLNITDQSLFDDEEVEHHHRMVCTFRENAEMELTEVNAIVETIRIQLEAGRKIYEITLPEPFETTAPTLNVTGSATLTIQPPV